MHTFIVTRCRGSARRGWKIEHFPVKAATSAKALKKVKTEWGDNPTCRWEVRVDDMIEVEVLVRCSWAVTVKISRDEYKKAVVVINSPNAADAGDFAWLDRSLPKSDVEYRVIDINPVNAAEKFRLCNRTACKAPGATWWNESTRAFYCTACAHRINEYAPGLCTDKREE